MDGPNLTLPDLIQTIFWFVLCLGSFCAMGRFVPWVVMSLVRFEFGSFCVLGRIELGLFCAWVIRDGSFCMCIFLVGLKKVFFVSPMWF